MANKNNTKKEETKEAMMTENEALEEAFEEEVEVKKKKGFRNPLTAIKEFKEDFEENHPVATRRIRRACDVAKGVGLGALATVATLSYIGSKREGSDGNETLALPDLGDNSNDSDDNPPAGLE